MKKIISLLSLILLSPFAYQPLLAQQSDPSPLSVCTDIAKAGERLKCYNAVVKQRLDCVNKIDAQARLHCFDAYEEERGANLPPDVTRKLTAIEARVFSELGASGKDSGRWVITPHYPTYILPASYNFEDVNIEPFELAVGEGSEFVDPDDLKEIEAKMQISFKIPMFPEWFEVFGKKSNIYFGYTILSAWQVYAGDASSPFRDNNYQPEAFWTFKMDTELGPLDWDFFSVSLNHQSNGRSDPLSRSWNRIIASFTASTDNWLFILRPWYRIPEDNDDDNNPNIEDYIGYGEFWTYYKYRSNTFGMMLQNNFLFDNNRTTIQLDWSFPIHSKLSGYVQYFYGYKETMIDYDYKNNKIGIGVILTNVM